MEFNTQDKNEFIKTINEKGFMLEERTWKILQSEINRVRHIKKGVVIDYNNNRIEIDALLQTTTGRCFILECKRTKFSWIFPKLSTQDNTVNEIYFDKTKGLQVRSNITSRFTSVFSDISIMLNDDETLERNQQQRAKTSYKDIHEHLRQVLKNTEAHLSTFRNDDKITNINFIGVSFFPVIVTNSPLYILKYNSDNINTNGDLTDYESVESVPYLIYNFSEVMRWDNSSQIIENVHHRNYNLKSVFIVNINHLTELVTYLERGY